MRNASKDTCPAVAKIQAKKTQYIGERELQSQKDDAELWQGHLRSGVRQPKSTS